MPKQTFHEAFGLLVPDEWNDDLLTLRRFSRLAPFKGEPHPSLEAKEQPWVDDWEDHLAELAKVVRKFGVRDALHEKGVFEVYVEVSGEEGPSEEQAALYRQFCDAEEALGDRVIDAMLRYYRSARINIPDCFPDNPSEIDGVADLPSVVEFDCMTVGQKTVDDLCPLMLSWSPSWDEEHGLKSLVYDGQVILMGTDEVDNALDGLLDDNAFEFVWKRSVMTEQELAALDRFRQHAEVWDDEE